MTKGKRRRKREQRRKAAQDHCIPRMPAGVELAETKHNSIEKHHPQSAEQGTQENINVLLKASIAKWFRDNSNPFIAAFTLVIAVATIMQACIYHSQLQEMRIDQRAWLAVKFTAFASPVLNAKVPAPVVVMNIGKTVAKNLDGWIFFRPVPIGTTIDLTEPAALKPSSLPAGQPIPAWTKFGTGVIYPTDPVMLPQALMVNTPVGETIPRPLVWDQSLQDQWTRGDIYIALHGRFTYDDAAGNSHWTTFCSLWVAANSGKNVSMDTATLCNNYNTVDSTKYGEKAN
ncbi:MAG TPA: hypothetical protein VNY51_02215 [Candidatus Dormibacteraeota bacterium]|nr:hypothetical protein [Candidatus Dormibacteraeota bacterium]